MDGKIMNDLNEFKRMSEDEQIASLKVDYFKSLDLNLKKIFMERAMELSVSKTPKEEAEEIDKYIMERSKHYMDMFDSMNEEQLYVYAIYEAEKRGMFKVDDILNVVGDED